MKLSYLVIDSFCDRLDDVRCSALMAGFGTWRPGRGGMAEAELDGMGFGGFHSLLIHALIKGTGLYPIPNLTHFRLTTKKTEKAKVHADTHAGSHTCILYLSKHEEKHGTAFWRHKETGLISMPSPGDALASNIINDIQSGDESKWEMLDLVYGEENRALVFKAPLFHSRYPIDNFGDRDHVYGGRLVWILHFNVMEDFA
jgi:hypothetical protein